MKALKDAGATIENGPDGNPTCFRTAPATPPPATSGEDGTRNALCGNNSCLANTTSNSNVYINKPACDPYNADFRQCKQGTGTNVGGLPGGTVSDIRNLASSCGCKVVITGGTEAGHSSHGANIPVFDLSKTDTLYNFIKTNATVKDNPSFCTVGSGSCYKKWLYNGYWFTDESGGPNTAHWHVCKDGTVAPPGKPAGLYIKACTKV